jgi:hypothetical protein
MASSSISMCFYKLLVAVLRYYCPGQHLKPFNMKYALALQVVLAVARAIEVEPVTATVRQIQPVAHSI